MTVFVYYFDNYLLEKLPLYAFEKDVLYMGPKSKIVADPGSPWYNDVPVGKNSLSVMVKKMCSDAEIAKNGKKAYHSLRATGIMFRNNVPEKIIQKTTGHRSIEALGSYERVSLEQETSVSKVLMSNENAGVEASVEKTTSDMAHIFEDLTNCQVTVNVNSSVSLAKQNE